MSDPVDVVVVGAGLSGMLLAERLCARGLRCVVLEAGPLPAGPLPADPASFATEKQDLLSVDDDAWRFRATREDFEWVRVRAGGGRSLLWGGWCVAPEAHCFEQARLMGAPWPRPLEDLEPFLDEARRALNAREAAMHPRLAALGVELGVAIHPKLAALSPSGTRPLVALDWQQRAEVRPWSVALRVLRDGRGRAAGVEIVDPRDATTSRVHARTVVLCASPVETARILHASDPDGVGASDGPLGRGLVDHIVSGFLVVTEGCAPTLELPAPTERAAWFCHPPEPDGRPGFLVELRGPVALSTLDGEDLEALGVSAEEAQGLSYFAVHAIGEAAPHPQRLVRFDTDARDALGRRVPELQLAWSSRDRLLVERLDARVHEVAVALAGEDGAVIRLRDPLDPGGIGHEAGTCRMGLHPDESVTEPSGEVRGLPGVFLGDASVMPTALDRHPSWTLLALTLGTAEVIIGRASRGEL